MDTETYSELAQQDLDAAAQLDPEYADERLARGQVHAVLAVAAALDRLARAIEGHD